MHNMITMRAPVVWILCLVRAIPPILPGGVAEVGSVVGMAVAAAASAASNVPM